MSIKVSNYVWQNAKHRGTAKLVLLALADFANDNGVCWPSVATVASRVNESERHVRRVIKDLVETGDLLTSPGGGRGHTTRYGIAVGLTPKQRIKLISVLRNSVLDNTVSDDIVSKETVTSGVGNSDMSGTETVTSGVITDVAFAARQSIKPPQKSQGIRHVDPSLDPSEIVDAANAAPPAPAASQKTTRTKHERSPEEQAYLDRKKAIEAAYVEALGYTPVAFAQEAKAAKALARYPYTPEQVVGCLRHLQADAWYADKHISLQTVAKQIGAWVQSQQTNARRTPEPSRPETRYWQPPDPNKYLSPAELAVALRAASEKRGLRTIGEA